MQDLVLGNGDAFALEVVGSVLYWTDWNNPGIYRAGTNGQKMLVLQRELLIGLNDVKYYDREKKKAIGKTIYDSC